MAGIGTAVIRFEDQYYILATSSMADDRTRVLKHGESFAVFDRHGDVQPAGFGEQGLYHEGTRFLSHLRLRLGEERPVLLSSTLNQNNSELMVDLMNPDFEVNEAFIARGTIHISRSKFLLEGCCYEQIRVHNYGNRTIEVPLTIEADADFRDIFEVRGMSRPHRGRFLPAEAEEDALSFRYKGLDGVIRTARMAFSPKPQDILSRGACFSLRLGSRQMQEILVVVSCRLDSSAPPSCLPFEAASGRRARISDSTMAGGCRIHTSNDQFNNWLSRSLSDLRMLLTETGQGLYPYAGIPWFSTAFGRDGIITALQTLWMNPEIARGVLRFLAATQAQESNPETDADPGKILHETRLGEMAALREVPFWRYYGSVDSTPLFILLSGAYHRATGDLPFIQEHWPNIEAALRWIDVYGDMDRDGFVEYARRSPKGLVQQGWKDSHDSVFHADGTVAEPPIALCEVQGYVYAAKREAAAMARALGFLAQADIYEAQASQLQERFEEAFWCEEISSYALALDAKKQACRVRTSNAGHCLYARIARPDRARRVAKALLGDTMFSGWGIRTVDTRDGRYNPMSYHNGSVWPHDNALIAHGLAQYGMREEALRVLAGMFNASQFFDLNRMPELFCGFDLQPGQAPTEYPVACQPQAWAAGAVFLLLQACLGLEPDAPAEQLRLRYPALPPFLERVEIRDLRVGEASLDIEFQRHPDDVGINIKRREGNIEVISYK